MLFNFCIKEWGYNDMIYDLTSFVKIYICLCVLIVWGYAHFDN